MDKPIISADSHITEPPNTYVERIDHKYKDSAPRMVPHEKLGDVFIVKDIETPLSLSFAAAAESKPGNWRSSETPAPGSTIFIVADGIRKRVLPTRNWMASPRR
jgi:hypothetical protein